MIRRRAKSNFSFPVGGGLQHPLVWVGVLGGTLLALYVFNLLWWLALPFVLSIVLYYLCTPFVTLLKQRGMSHGQAMGTILVVGTLLALLFLALGFPWMTAKVYQAQEKGPGFMLKLQDTIINSAVELEDRYPGVKQAAFSEEIRKQLTEVKQHFVNRYLQEAVVYVITWVPSMLLVPYLTFFLLKDGGAFKRLVMRGVPNAFFEKVLLLFHRMDSQIKKYFQGLFAMTLLDTVTLGMGLFFLGLPFGMFPPGQALFLGLVAAVLAWVPYIGSIIGCVLIVVVSLVSVPDEPLLLGGAILLFVVVRLIDDFFYTPMTVGKSLSVHPLVTVLIIFAGGMIGGVSGLLLAMPVLGVAMVLGDIFGQVWFDERLRARYDAARKLRQYEAKRGLFSPGS